MVVGIQLVSLRIIWRKIRELCMRKAAWICDRKRINSY